MPNPLPNPSPNPVLQADLDKAIPALDAAQKALELLNKKDMAEVKAYAKPPPAVETVMEAVMVLRKQEPTWAEAKKQLEPYSKPPSPALLHPCTSALLHCAQP